jgi:hypothetical protein
MHAYEVDQIAARNNRPDLVLQRIGLGTPALLEHFAARHRRRLERMGLSERASASPFAGAPGVRILDVDSNRNQATVTFEATAHGPALASYHLFVNEVPVLGLAGAPLAGAHQRATAQVELTPGRNRIEVSARSVDGVESLREYRTVELDQKARPDLYVLAFGVSHYKNPAYDLSYAHKDAIDLASVLASMEGRGYGQVFTRLLTDGEVTVDALREAKARLSQARPEDVLVVQVAGHGMYDRDSEYYFLTHEVDLTRLAQTAAPFRRARSFCCSTRATRAIAIRAPPRQERWRRARAASVRGACARCGSTKSRRRGWPSAPRSSPTATAISTPTSCGAPVRSCSRRRTATNTPTKATRCRTARSRRRSCMR